MAELTNDIRFTTQIAHDLKSALANGSFSKIFVLTDSNTRKDCLPIILDVLPEDHFIIEIPAGEENKTIATCEKIWDKFTLANADRYALLINLGGGVICDMGGFCARTYKRGIAFWNIPTTVLSQVDASVGGKLGVDFGSYKNHIGLFSEPDIVFIDSVFFKTLERKEIISGFAEMIKHTLIRDAQGFNKLSQVDIDSIDWSEWIPKSVEVKKTIVEADPLEKGLRKILNFGHTIGHAIESYYLGTEKQLKHGEAIAIGMICEGYLSVKKLDLTQEILDKLFAVIKRYFPLPGFADEELNAIANLTVQDKKNKDGQINAVLLKDIANPEIDVPVSNSEIKESLNYYNQLVK